MNKLVPWVAALFLTACGAATPAPSAPLAEAPAPSEAEPEALEAPEEAGDACVGTVDPAPAGLAAVDEAPPGFALGEPGKGSLCEARVFVADKPTVVFRLFSASYETSKRAGPLGAYWALQKPSGSATDYRASYEICTEWNDLDMLNECKVEVGAKIVIGPGQSATCEDGSTFPPSAKNQALIVKTAEGKVPVTDCVASPMVWAE